MYRLPPQDMYRPSAQDPYRGPSTTQQQQQQHLAFNQPAPRQRTAIACRYCRRRKVRAALRPSGAAGISPVLIDWPQIRCSGFESSEDGRCTNCQRFNQECIFTPVSSQAQAFVPAHTAYPHLRSAGAPGRSRPIYAQNPPVIYGAHGQPLNTVSPHGGPYPADVGYPHASPGGSYAVPAHEVIAEGPHRHRGSDDLLHGLPASVRRGSSTERQYRDPSGQRAQGSPTSSTTSYQSYSHSNPAQPYYGDPRGTPPQASYAFDRPSHSPRDSGPTGSGAYPFPGPHPPLSMPSYVQGGGTSPPPPQPQRQPPDERRPGMSIQNLLDQSSSSGQGQPRRSATDHEMLDALMPRRGI